MEQLEQKWRCEDTKTVKVLVHRINMGDVEDPDFLISWPMYEWQQTEKGKWVMDKSFKPPIWQRSVDVNILGYTYCIFAYLKESDYIYYKLRYE